VLRRLTTLQLYKVDVLTLADVQKWLKRFLFDTVFPGVPSLFELEAGCALLITIGAKLESVGQPPSMREGSGSFTSYEIMGASTSPLAPLRRAIPGDCNGASTSPSSILLSCIDRLGDIQQIDETPLEGKSWCREVVALHQRNWQPLNRAEQLSTVSALAAQAARRARRAAVSRPVRRPDDPALFE
jgi:hypothetical protein